MRNDVSGALHDDGVADQYVLALDLIGVVERRIGDDDAADGDGLQPRDGRENARASDVDLNVAQDRRRAFGGKFMRRRPARRARDEAQTLLQREVVHLVDDSVYVIAQRRASRFDLAIAFEHGLDALAARHQGVDGKTKALERLDHFKLSFSRRLADLTERIGEEAQGPAGGDRGIELTQRARRRVARIGEEPLFRRSLARVERRKILMRHVDLAAHLQHGGRAVFERLGNVVERTDIRGHILALKSVAARRCVDEAAALIAQRAGEAVDFRLRGEDEIRRVSKLEKAAHPRGEVDDLFVREDVAEREHRHGVTDSANFSAGGAPTFW